MDATRLVIALLFCAAMPSSASADHCNAGAIVFAVIDGRTYVLLADNEKEEDRHRGWGGLGGGCEDSESHFEAAVREVYQESKGIYSEEALGKAIDPDLFAQQEHFTTYFVRSDFLPGNVFSNQPPIPGVETSKERGPFAWFLWDDVLAAADEVGTSSRIDAPKAFLPAKRHSTWYFVEFLKTVKFLKDGAVSLPLGTERRVKPTP